MSDKKYTILPSLEDLPNRTNLDKIVKWDPMNAHPMQLAYKNDNLQYNDYCNEIIDEILVPGLDINNKSIVKKHFKTVILNLLYNWIDNRMVSISFNQNNYCAKAKEKYRPDNKHHQKDNWMTYDQATFIVDSLEKLDYIKVITGFIDRDTGRSFWTRIHPNNKMIVKMEKYMKLINIIDTETKYDEQFEDLVILRENNDKIVKYKDNNTTRRSIKLLSRYNKLLLLSNIHYTHNISYNTITNRVWQQPIDSIDSNTIQQLDFYAYNPGILKRMFCRGSFERGGRYYTTSVRGVYRTHQSMSKEHRANLTINGEPIVEVDYPSHHLNLIRDLHNMTKPINAYEVIHPTLGLVPRKLVKKITLIAINHGNITRLKQTILNDTMTDDIDLYNDLKEPWLNQLDSVIKLVLEANKDIEDFICSDYGVQLQRVDSDITTLILEHFTNKGIACLPVHDSYIVPKSYENELKDVMEHAYNEVVSKYKEKFND